MVKYQRKHAKCLPSRQEPPRLVSQNVTLWATGEQHREAYFITPLFLWALKSFIKSLTKFLLFIAYCCCLADISAILFVIKLLQCAKVNTLNCPRCHPRCSQSIRDHIILRDISSVRVHLISEGTNLKIGNDILIFRVPGHTQGAEVSQLVTR